MNKLNRSAGSKRQILVQPTTIVQHNSLGTWDVFLSLFGSLIGTLHTDIVLLQDPPSSKGFLPRFAGFKSFSPPSLKPKMACYVSLDFSARYAILARFYDNTPDTMFLYIYTPGSCFGTPASTFRIGNVYAPECSNHARTVPPEIAFQQLDSLYLVAGDSNIHNPATNPSWVFSYSDELSSAPFHNLASDLRFKHLNAPVVYTRFPLSGSHRQGVIDLAFSNPQMSPAFSTWDALAHP